MLCIIIAFFFVTNCFILTTFYISSENILQVLYSIEPFKVIKHVGNQDPGRTCVHKSCRYLFKPLVWYVRCDHPKPKFFIPIDLHSGLYFDIIVEQGSSSHTFVGYYWIAIRLLINNIRQGEMNQILSTKSTYM